MELSGELICKGTAEEVRAKFFDVTQLRKHYPNCKDIEELEPGFYRIRMSRWVGGDGEIEHFVRLMPGDTDREFTFSSKAVDKRPIIIKSQCHIILKESEMGTTMSYQVSLCLANTPAAYTVDRENTLKLISTFFKAIAENGQNEEIEMTDKENDMEFEKVLHSAEDAVLELEHEAEEAAAKGFLGGAQMWGIIALGIVIVILLIFFR